MRAVFFICSNVNNNVLVVADPGKGPRGPPPLISEFTQQDGRKKRTAKQLCVTNVTGLSLVGFLVIFT